MVALWIIGGLIATAIFVGVISWKAINDWLTFAKAKGTWAKIIKDRLDTGEFVVVGGVFDDQDNVVEEKAWRAMELDEELRQKFYGSNQYKIRF